MKLRTVESLGGRAFIGSMARAAGPACHARSIGVITPVVNDQIAAWSQAGRLQWEARSYESGDLRDAFLVVSVADAETNGRVFQEAETRKILCNAVDDVSTATAIRRRLCAADLCRSPSRLPAESGSRPEAAERT